MQPRFLKLVENWSFGGKITKILVSDAILNFAAIFSKSKLPNRLLRRNTKLSTGLHKKIVLTKPLDGNSVKFPFRKEQPISILVFSCHFDFFANHLLFPKIMNIL
jgi:hypothetical protein